MFACKTAAGLVFGEQALSKELEAGAKGEELVYPFTSKVYDSANTALFYAQNGRLDVALRSLQGMYTDSRRP